MSIILFVVFVYLFACTCFRNEEDINPLDFHEAQLCEVMSITVVTPYKEAILHVKSIDKLATASCRVRGCWSVFLE